MYFIMFATPPLKVDVTSCSPVALAEKKKKRRSWHALLKVTATLVALESN